MENQRLEQYMWKIIGRTTRAVKKQKS